KEKGIVTQRFGKKVLLAATIHVHDYEKQAKVNKHRRYRKPLGMQISINLVGFSIKNPTQVFPMLPSFF
ncbi:MAG: hypothetical protein KDC64_12355, partial [Aequorivita sp.]|nr:hypothetical protein [Aequorivita sp.]